VFKADPSRGLMAKIAGDGGWEQGRGRKKGAGHALRDAAPKKEGGAGTKFESLIGY